VQKFNGIHPLVKFNPSSVLLAWGLVTQRFASRSPFVRRNDVHRAPRPLFGNVLCGFIYQKPILLSPNAMASRTR
jgi:hypothetical protein